jgi:hypothetical protein
MKLKFKVKKQTHDDCEHESGIIHSRGTSCEEAERIMKIFAMDENDPDHHAFWHDPKRNPDLIVLEC